MEAIIQGLQSTQVPIKAKTLEDLILKLENPKFLSNAMSDVRMRLLSMTINLIKDANPKIVLLSLDCLTIFLEKYSEYFQSLTNLTFDYVIGKLGDAKIQIRSKSISSLISLVNYVGLVAGYQKLTPLFSNKNSRMREQVLTIIFQLHDIYRDELAALPEIISKIHPLLKDPVESVRQLATQVCGCLYQTMGESLVLELRNPDHKNDALFESIRQSAMMRESIGEREAPNINNRLSSSGPCSPIDIPKSKSSGNLSSTSIPRPKSYDGRPLRSPVNNSPQTRAEETVPLKRITSASNSVGTESSEGATSINKYMPSSYFGILGDGQPAPPIFVMSERDFSQHMSSIQASLLNKDDWQARQNGLLKLQGLLKGIFENDEMNQDYLSQETVAQLLIEYIRTSLHETISTQISDLRSTVSKEACRTVAMMARVMRGNVYQLVELWIPPLLKLLLVKIQVIMSAADRCLRTIIVCGSPNGFPKVLQILLETLSSKSPAVRKYCLEYITLAAISWESDSAFERNSVGLKKAIQSGVSDADPQARKTARVLYWLLRQRPAWSRPLQLLVDLLDNTTKKNLDTEQYQSEFLEIIRNRAYLSNIDVYDLDWKDMDTPHFSRNASLSSSGRLSVGSDMPSLKSDDEDDIRKNDDKLTSLQDPELIDQTEGMADSSLPQPEMSANRVDKIETPNLREQTIALKSNKQFSASTGNLGRTGGIGGGCQRLTVAPKLPQTEEENHEKPNPTSARASLSTSLMTKRLNKAASVRSEAPLVDSVEKDKELPVSQSRMTIGAQRVMMPQRVAASEPAKIERSALRVQRAPSVQTSVEIEPSSLKAEKERISDATQTSGSTSALAEIKALINDQLWSNRITGLQAANDRFKRWMASATSDSTHPTQLEELLDIIIKCLNDFHQRVSAEANTAIMTLSTTQNSLLASRLNILLPLLFNRLNDRKQLVRSQATEMLDSIRSAYDPCTLMALLSPRIIEVPERTLISIIQFMITIAPVCSSYFNQPQNTGAFLNRMAIVISPSRRPSSSLIICGQRLIDLVYKAATDIVLLQISSLPLQYQSELKKALAGRVPNIDLLVASASKTEARQSGSLISEGFENLEEISRASRLNIMTSSESTDYSEDYDREDVAKKSSPIPSPVLAQPFFHSPIERNDYNPAIYSPGAQPLPQTQQLLSPSPITSAIYDNHLPPTPPPPRIISPMANIQKENTLPDSPGMKGGKDIVWLLHTLRYDGGANRDEKKKAIAELKRLAKSASEDYWKRNCAQIVSVLLEAFTPPTRGLYDPLLPLSPQLKQSSHSYLPSPPLTGLSPSHRNDRDEKISENELEEEILYNQRMESMHIASKGLLILIKLLGKNHLKGFLELIVCRLCQAVSYAPVAISLHFQEILNLISSFDSPRIITLLLPYITKDSTPTSADLLDDQDENSKQATRLLALQSLPTAITHLTSPQLIELLPSIIEAVLPHFTSSLVDIRKGVVFILVEIYLIIGDSLYPYVKGLAPSQKKLLTVYIERQMNRNSHVHHASMPYDM